MPLQYRRAAGRVLPSAHHTPGNQTPSSSETDTSEQSEKLQGQREYKGTEEQ